jgi:hypothetical protein
LAEARQADVSDKAYELYSAALHNYPESDVREVVTAIAKRRRGEGEKAFPSLGDLIEPLENMAAMKRQGEAERKRREEETAYFWKWVDEQVAVTGKPEQEILDSIRTPGYVGLMARA